LVCFDELAFIRVNLWRENWFNRGRTRMNTDYRPFKFISIMHNVCFLGEAIHGVAEFTNYKHQWLAARDSENVVVVFEADHVGMLHSAMQQESAERVLLNFPKIHRTHEMLALLEFVVGNKIPYYGADVVTRNKTAVFTGELLLRRKTQEAKEAFIYAQADPFTLRDKYMAEAMAGAMVQHPQKTIAGFFHNFHIKKRGSLEEGHFKLCSVAENLAAIHQTASRSIGLFAAQGNALDNDRTSFQFNNINDAEVIESLATSDSKPLIIKDKTVMGKRTAYHHAFEKEHIPAARQYDECVIFHTATVPHPC
jgi:erythromycin esterase-like protein